MTWRPERRLPTDPSTRLSFRERRLPIVPAMLLARSQVRIPSLKTRDLAKEPKHAHEGKELCLSRPRVRKHHQQ